MKKLRLKEFCEILNNQDEWKLENYKRIADNGFTDRCAIIDEVCDDGNEKIIIGENGKYKIVSL